MTAPVGLVYPIPPALVERVFRDRKNVFVKFQPHGDVLPTVTNGESVLLLYVSGWQSLAGQAVIESSKALLPQQVLDEYKDDLFLTADEFWAYVGDRRNKPLAVFVLSQSERYPQPISCPFVISKSGRYLYPEQYDHIRALVSVANTRRA